jgi:hypothetical protein
VNHVSARRATAFFNGLLRDARPLMAMIAWIAGKPLWLAAAT